MDVNDNGKEVNHETARQPPPGSRARSKSTSSTSSSPETCRGGTSSRRGTAFGLSLPLLGGILEAKGWPAT